MNAKIPRVGAEVVTSDGHLVGRVVAVVGECFKVDKPMAPDQWLGVDTVSDIRGDVHLKLTRDELQGKPEGIDHFGYHVHRET